VAGRVKRTEDRATEIVQNIELGCTRKRACAIVGMSTDTLTRWEKADAAFAARLNVAEARRDRSLIVDIRTAAKGDWRAAAWLLERVAKDDYGTRTEIVGKDGGPIRIDQTTRDLSAFTDDQIDKLAEVAEQVKTGVRSR
jgi:hypothetical protein